MYNGKGQEVEIEEWDRDLLSNRETIQSRISLPKKRNKPTTSIYARGRNDDSVKVESQKTYQLNQAHIQSSQRK